VAVAIGLSAFGVVGYLVFVPTLLGIALGYVPPGWPTLREIKDLDASGAFADKTLSQVAEMVGGGRFARMNDSQHSLTIKHLSWLEVHYIIVDVDANGVVVSSRLISN
jgi:hypothetical protein